MESQDTEYSADTDEPRDPLRPLIDNLDIGVFSIDRPYEGTFSQLNPACARILGYASVEEALGASVMGHYSDPKERAETFARFLGSPAFNDRGAIKFEAQRLRHDNGEPVDVLLTLTVKVDETGRATRIDGAVEDIGQRRKSETAFRASEQRFRIIFETIGIASALTDGDGRIVRVNPAFLAFVGYDEPDVVGRFLDDFLYQADRTPGLVSRQTAAPGPRAAVSSELRFVRRDGGIAWGLATVSWLNDKDGHQTGVVMIQDLTERRRREDDQLRIEKLESLAVLAGGIAHDFNNILTAVMGNISLAAETMGVPQSAYERLLLAERATTRARDLTQQLITFAKGGAPLKRPAFLPDVVRESASLFLRGSNVRCDVTVEPGLPPADVDLGQMVQVFNNLLLNAAQAMPDGGRVEVRLAPAELPPDNAPGLKPGRYLKIEVEDHGRGIPPEQVNRVFDPYFSTRPQGTGLGLATVYSILRRHEGHVEVRSKEGFGTTFTLLLPASDKSPEPGSQVVARTAPPRATGRILVMDDEPTVREVAVEILRRCGYEADEAADGDQAVDAWRLARDAGRPYDVVILDLTVPGAPGGAEAIARMRQFDPNVKAIVSSGYSASAVLARYKDHGFAGVVAKPYTIEELKDAVERLMPREPGRDGESEGR
jgi:PAS domain S-box-containing protein